MVTMYTSAERPDLWERGIESAAVWPEYNLHGDFINQWWGLLDVELPEFQFVLVDEAEERVVAEGHTGPLAWDGRDEMLPPGIDDTLQMISEQSRTTVPVNTLCALAAEVPRDNRQRGLPAQILTAMRTIAERNGLRHLVAPVRPSWKVRYPITPIEKYVRWRRADGQLFDPWMRIHERLGARVAQSLPRSLRITGTIAEWESWTGLALPESGDYVFTEGVAVLHVETAADLGPYWEPNVWMIHPDITPA